MRKIALCLAVLLSAVTVSTVTWANGDELPPPELPPPPPTHVLAPEVHCVQPSCEHVVTRRRIVGYREEYIPEHVARVPVYHRYRKVVHEECCAPPAEVANIEAPPPKTVVRDQDIYVKIIPHVHYIYPRVHFQPRVCCLPGENIPNLPPCPPNGSSFVPGLYSPASVQAASVDPVGHMIANGCPAGVKLGEIFACPTSRTGQCICK